MERQYQNRSERNPDAMTLLGRLRGNTPVINRTGFTRLEKGDHDSGVRELFFAFRSRRGPGSPDVLRMSNMRCDARLNREGRKTTDTAFVYLGETKGKRIIVLGVTDPVSITKKGDPEDGDRIATQQVAAAVAAYFMDDRMYNYRRGGYAETDIQLGEYGVTEDARPSTFAGVVIEESFDRNGNKVVRAYVLWAGDAGVATGDKQLTDKNRDVSHDGRLKNCVSPYGIVHYEDITDRLNQLRKNGLEIRTDGYDDKENRPTDDGARIRLLKELFQSGGWGDVVEKIVQSVTSESPGSPSSPSAGWRRDMGDPIESVLERVNPLRGFVARVVGALGRVLDEINPRACLYRLLHKDNGKGYVSKRLLEELGGLADREYRSASNSKVVYPPHETLRTFIANGGQSLIVPTNLQIGIAERYDLSLDLFRDSRARDVLEQLLSIASMYKLAQENPIVLVTMVGNKTEVVRNLLDSNSQRLPPDVVQKIKSVLGIN